MCGLLTFIEIDTHVQQVVDCVVLELTFVVLTKSSTEIKMIVLPCMLFSGLLPPLLTQE